MACAIGIDFGTESVRTVVVETATGATLATAVERYSHGVIDRVLPDREMPLPPEWALQHPDDWLTGLEGATRAAVAQAGIAPAQVAGIGIDFTSCTILPTTADGTPLCAVAELSREPHAWPKLWKHHAAQSQADRITEAATVRSEPWLPRYGGRISSEWLLPKAWQIAEEAPAVYGRAAHVLEGGDWVAWQLTGVRARNACAAGYKGLWHKLEGYPPRAFLESLDPVLAGFYEEKAAGPVLAPGVRVGGLTPAWAARLGLPEGVPVGAPIIDAHAAALGGGVAVAGPLFLIMGTSTCHLLMAPQESLVPGIAGVVEDGIVPGLHAYEAGQAAVGDMLAWYVQQAAPPDCHDEARASGRSVHEVLSARAAGLAPGATGLVALDWWNGNRCTLMNSELSGLVVGLTLGTRPEHVYRTLVEATAFGTRVIAEAFEDAGLPATRLVAGGGLTQNPLVMEVYADVCGRALEVAGTPQASALGAAMLGAVAAGRHRGGHDSLADAVAHMAPAPGAVYKPVERHRAAYDELYACYRELYDRFGRDSRIMQRLRSLRDRARTVD
jgi:L-ribulokinase